MHTWFVSIHERQQKYLYEKPFLSLSLPKLSIVIWTESNRQGREKKTNFQAPDAFPFGQKRKKNFGVFGIICKKFLFLKILSLFFVFFLFFELFFSLSLSVVWLNLSSQCHRDSSRIVEHCPSVGQQNFLSNASPCELSLSNSLVCLWRGKERKEKDSKAFIFS